ncbi:hypothetical protein Tco_0569573 [Tanacetum coccineum]
MLNMRQRRWVELLSGYDYELKNHPGKANIVADTLRRKERLRPSRVVMDEAHRSRTSKAIWIAAATRNSSVEVGKDYYGSGDKGTIRFRKRGKLNPRYTRPFKVLDKVGSVAYCLELPQELSGIHNVFHVSNLKKCLADEMLVVPLKELKITDKF